MSSFISKSACRGRRPIQFSGYAGFQRPNLMRRLLKERSVARFIVAPDGYGKTSLAIDYAETLFSWVHVFFVNGQSPCFIRDLDNGVLASQCAEVDKEGLLVIFDDIPALDAERARSFSREIDAILSQKCEVMVTCTPMCDVYGQLQRDRLSVAAAELLLTDEELDAVRSSDERMRLPSSKLPACRRVPGLVWAESDDAVQTFVRQAFKEQMPADLLIVISSMMVLQKGRLADLASFCALGAGDEDVLLDRYPHFECDADTGTFEAPDIPIEELAPVLRKRAETLVERSLAESLEGLAVAWADILLKDYAMAGRGCDVVRILCSKSARIDWLIGHKRDLVEAGCFYSALRTLRSIGGMSARSVAIKAQVISLEAVCRQVLGDDNGAVRCAKRYAFDESAPYPARVGSLLELVRFGPETQRVRASESLELLAQIYGEMARTKYSVTESLVMLWHASMGGVQSLGEEWRAHCESGVDDLPLLLGASWLFSMAADELRETGVLALDADTCAVVERFVRSRLESALPGSLDYLTASAALAMEGAHMQGMVFAAGPLAIGQLLELRHAELAVLAQRRQLERDIEDEMAKTSNWAETHPDSAPGGPAGLVAPYAQRNVPVLSIRLFGGFEVSIGGVPLDPRLFHRQNVRSLLALLAINQGRELSRDTLAHAMWPDSSSSIARRNFYSVWSRLKTVLTLPDGTCPYLIRHQYGCSLENRHVQSDVVRLKEICRELLFGAPDYREWPELYVEIERDYANDLMPSDSSNYLIVNARNEFRSRLVDALVAASLNIADVENAQWGIWFARSAVERDRMREDAYVALMKAQIAANQRTAAMMTYLECQKVLSNELGVDPSPEAQRLYQELIEGM